MNTISSQGDTTYMVLLPKSVSFVLTAFIFVILIINLVLSGIAAESDPLFKIKQFHSNFKENLVQPRQDLGQNWPLAKMTSTSQSLSPNSRITNFIPGQEMQLHDEELIMNKSNSEKNVEDLKAINRVKNRDIIYDDYQTNNDGKGNSVDIRVDNQQTGADIFRANDAFETSVDRALESGFQKTYGQGTPYATTGYKHLGNYLNIGVTGITVSAINTVPDGSAVANSNIIIKPVQIIVYPSEVEEKLK